MKDELVKKLENQVAVNLDDECWQGLQELYKHIDKQERIIKQLKNEE